MLSWTTLKKAGLSLWLTPTPRVLNRSDLSVLNCGLFAHSLRDLDQKIDEIPSNSRTLCSGTLLRKTTLGLPGTLPQVDA